MVIFSIFDSTILINFLFLNGGGGWGKDLLNVTGAAASCFAKRFIMEANTFGCGDVFIVESILTR